MITLRRDAVRRRLSELGDDVARSFDPDDPKDLLTDGFGALDILDEHRVAPGATLLFRPRDDLELVTYVVEGALNGDGLSVGPYGMPAGEFHCSMAAHGVRPPAHNASTTSSARAFQIWIRATRLPSESGVQQKRFGTGDRRAVLRVVASPDGRDGSLRVHGDARIYSSILFPGKHLVHEILAGRCAWLHIVRGRATLGGEVVGAGDGAGVIDERSVSLTASEDTELLLIDVAECGWPSSSNGRHR